MQKDDKGMTFKQKLSAMPPEVSKLYEDVYQILKDNPEATFEESIDTPPFEGFQVNPEFMKKCQSIATSVGFDHYLADRRKEVSFGNLSNQNRQTFSFCLKT